MTRLLPFLFLMMAFILPCKNGGPVNAKPLVGNDLATSVYCRNRTVASEMPEHDPSQINLRSNTTPVGEAITYIENEIIVAGNDNK